MGGIAVTTRWQGSRWAEGGLVSARQMILCLLAGLLILLSRPDQGGCHVTDTNMPDAVAETEYQILLEFQPERTEVRNKLAMVLMRKKKFTEAEEEFRTVLATEPDNFNGLDGLGLVMVMSRTGREKEAVDQFLKAIAINPQDVMVHYHLGLAYAALGDQLAAKQSYRQALDLAEQPSVVSPSPADLQEIRKALEIISPSPPPHTDHPHFLP